MVLIKVVVVDNIVLSSFELNQKAENNEMEGTSSIGFLFKTSFILLVI